MSAPRHFRIGSSRRLELHIKEMACSTYFFTKGQLGELLEMLAAEARGLEVPAASDETVAEAFQQRWTFSRLRGSFGRQNLPLSVRAEVFERDGATCRYCDAALTWDTYECDHVHPVSKGGSNDPQNLAAACEPCNRSKGAKTLEEWLGSK